MDNKELSKLKEIYKIYTSADGVVHCERYPIAYVNKKYVYYIVSNDDELSCKRMRSVGDSFKGVNDLTIYESRYLGVVVNQFFFNVENFDSASITKLVFEKNENDKIKKAESEVLRLTKKLNDVDEELKRSVKTLDELKKEK